MLKYILGILLAGILVISYYVFTSGVSPRPDDPIIRAVHYVGISVSDLDSSAALYENAFGLETVSTSTLQDAPALDLIAGRKNLRADTRLLRSSNAQLRLMSFQDKPEIAIKAPQQEVQGPGFAHVCLQVNQKTKAYDKFLEGGAAAIGDPQMIQLSERNPVRYAYARDPDNTIFEVEHVDVEALQLDSPPENEYRIRHVALASPDIDRSVEFYSVLLEQERPRRLGRLFAMSGEKLDGVSGLEGTQLKMAFFQLRNMELEIAQYVSHPSETPATPRPLESLGYNMVVFEVSSLSDARDLLLKAGGTISTEILPMDGGQIMFGRDVDNNLLGFQVLDEDSELSAAQFLDNGMR